MDTIELEKNIVLFFMFRFVSLWTFLAITGLISYCMDMRTIINMYTSIYAKNYVPKRFQVKSLLHRRTSTIVYYD